MKAKEYIIKDCKDPETGKCPTWGEIEKHISYDIYGTERLMEDYHQSRLKEIMPTDEEMKKEIFEILKENYFEEIPSEIIKWMLEIRNRET